MSDDERDDASDERDGDSSTPDESPAAEGFEKSNQETEQRTDDTFVAAESPVSRIAYEGTGSSLLGVYIKNNALIFLSLGFYASWAKANVRRYFVGQVALSGRNFAYHGTGGELFWGAFKVGLIYIVANALIALFETLSPALSAMFGLVYASALSAFVPFALYSTRRYRLSRLSWRGTRFSFRGNMGECYRVYLLGLFLTGVTLGLYYPVWHANTRRFWINGTRFGACYFSYDGVGMDLFRPFLKMWLLFIPTLGISGFWYAARQLRYDWEHTQFAELRFDCPVSGTEVFVVWLKTTALTVFTLGIGYAWAQTLALRFYLDRFTIRGDVERVFGESESRYLFRETPGVGTGGEAVVSWFDLDLDFGTGVLP